RERPGARVLGPVPDEEREEPGKEQAESEAVAEPCPAEKEGRPKTEPAGRPYRAGQVPRAIEGLVPTLRAGDRLAARRDPVEKHADRPDQLKATAALAPLIEQRDAEDQRQDRCERGEDDVDLHRSGFPLVGVDEPEEEPVEHCPCIAIELREVGRVERSPSTDRRELGDEGL